MMTTKRPVTRFTVDETGELLEGYFYHLQGIFCRHPALSGQTDKWIISSAGDAEKEFTYSVNLETTREVKVKCARDPAHVTLGRIKGLTVDLHGGKTGPIIPNPDYFLISETVDRRLRTAGFSNCDTVPVTINVDQSGATERIMLVKFTGANAIRADVVRPREGNRCWRCHFGPVICPECGEIVHIECPKCGSECVTYADEPEFEGDKRILVTSTPKLGVVIDVAKWDGSDFFQGRPASVVTRRVLDFFLASHVAPFRAEPLRAYVGGCDRKQLELLEKSRQMIRQ